MAKKINYAKILRGGDNKPTNPDLWEKAKAAAKAKFDVYPSAVANAWASRKYADEGGSWKQMAEGGEVTLTPADMTLVRRSRRQLEALPDLESGQISEGRNIFKGASDIFKKDPYSDEARAPEFFEEGYELESKAQPTEPGGQTFVFDNNSGIDFSSIEGQADGGMVGSFAALTTTLDKQKDSPFPQPAAVELPDNTDSAKLKSPQALASGGYVVTRSNERKGKTHKVTGPDGSVKFFGDPNLKNRPNNKEAKASWYARHAKSLAKNPHFRAYARATWAEGGMVADEPEYFQDGGISGGGGDAASDEVIDAPPDLQPAELIQYYDSAEKSGATLSEAQKEQKAEAQKKVEAEKKAAAEKAAAPAPAAPAPAAQTLSEEEKKKVLAKQKADAEAAGVPFTAAPTKPAAPAPAPAGTEQAKAPGITISTSPTGESKVEVKPAAVPAPAVSADDAKKAQREEFARLFGPKPQADERRGPLGVLREQVRLLEKYGEKGYGNYEAIRKKVLVELGGNDKDPRVKSEAARIAEEVLDRRLERKGVGGEPAPVQKAAPATPPVEGKAQPIPPAAVEPPAVQPTAGGVAAPIAPTAAPTAGGVGAVEAGREGRTAAVDAGVQAAEATAQGVLPAEPTLAAEATATTFPVLTDATGKKYTLQDLAIPSIRYSTPVMDELRTTGDFILVRDAALSVSQERDPAKKLAAAEKIAADEVLRTKGLLGIGGLGPVPSGLTAMEAARQTPEYQAILQAAAERADIRRKDVELQVRQADVERQIKNAQADLQLKQLEDYELRKAAIDSQAAQLRAAVLQDKVDPDRYFAGRGVGRVIGSVLGILGKGLGAQGSVQDFIQQKIKDDIQLQLSQMDKRRTLLGTLVTQGNSLDESYRLADAFYKNLFAAQLERASGGIRDERAKLQALDAANQLRMDAAVKAENVVKGQVDAIYEPYKLKLQNAGSGVKSAAEYLRIPAPIAAAKYRAATKKGPAAPPDASDELKAFFEGKSLDQGQFARVNLEATQKKLDPRLGEKVVKVLKQEQGTFTRADGTKVPYTRLVVDPQRVLLAYDRTAKENATKQTSSALAFMSKLDKLEGLLAKYNYSGVQALANPTDKGAIEVLVGELASDLGVLRNIGVPQEAEYQRIVESLPTLALFQTEAFPQSKFSTFRGLMNDAIMRARDQSLVGGGLSGTGAASAMPPPTKPTARPKK